MAVSYKSSFGYTGVLISVRLLEFDAHDAVALCHIPPRVITSPNINWVPQPFIFEDELVQARADGRLGTADSFQWPQLYTANYPWAVAIKRNFFLPDEPLAAVWYTPSYDDFVRIPNSALPIGSLNPDRLDALARLMDQVKVRVNAYKRGKHHLRVGDQSVRMVQSLRVVFNHLDRFPLTYRDTVASVAEFQRAVLDFHAYCDYHAFILPRIERPQFPFPEVNTQWMGAFTGDVLMAESLFRAGVPVWYVRPETSVTSTTIIQAVVTPRQPEHIVLGTFCDPVKKFAKPFPVRYVGPAGVERETACRHFNKECEMEAYKFFSGEDAPSQGGPSMDKGGGRGPQERRKERRKDRVETSRPCQYYFSSVIVI